MSSDFDSLITHDQSDDCIACRAQDVVGYSLVPAVATWEESYRLPRHALALHGAAGLMAFMIQNGAARDEVERRKPYQNYLDAELGLRNHWYPALFGQELKEGETRGEMLLGERIYFRRAGGAVYAVEDRCRHRGAASHLTALLAGH